MTLTTLDPRTALIVVDLQKGIVATPVAHPADEIVARAAELVVAFHDLDLPVVLVRATGRAPGRTDADPEGGSAALPGGDWADLVDELDVRPGDLRIQKQTWGAFTGTPLHAELTERGVTQVVVVGIATTAGVESTARSAHELGYHVVVATDAMTDRSAEAHDHSVRWVFPRIAQTATSADIVAALPQA